MVTFVCKHLKCLCWLKIPPTVKYKVWFVLLVLKAAEIPYEISDVYGENIMSEGTVQEWVRAFKNGNMNIYDVEQIERPSGNTGL